MIDHRTPDPTCTRFCKRPDLARGRLEVRDLRASSAASRPAEGPWSTRVEVQVEARDLAGPTSESLRMTLSGYAALCFGLDLLEGAAFCYLPESFYGRDPERESSPLPADEELRLLALAVRARATSSPEAERDVAWLIELCDRAPPSDGSPLVVSPPVPWPLAGRFEREIEGLRRAGLVEVSGFGPATRARPTAAGRALSCMLRKPEAAAQPAAEWGPGTVDLLLQAEGAQPADACDAIDALTGRGDAEHTSDGRIILSRAALQALVRELLGRAA
jgi:hypothetical protein